MKTLTLSRCYVAGSANFASLNFRAPKLLDYRQIGVAIEAQRGVVVRYSEAIWAYADRLVQDINPGALGELYIVDALAVEELIIDFFTAASQQLREPESLSSESAG